MITSRRSPTPFEERVYAVVRGIPKGQVRSYRWVAERLGDAHLARAVGQALKRNPDSQHTPCHRVIRSDGSLGGYAWGPAANRRRLLADNRGHKTSS
ncbi:MAG: MGMT family protein [Candidatus Omnitrophica bacterium]|nr:MGMT family protein [Candidatus Omnitrophota bacterium]